MSAAHRIEQSAINEGVLDFNVSASLQAFLDSNAQYQSSMVQVSSALPATAVDKKIFHHVDLTNKQLQGVYQGYLMGRSLTAPGAFVPCGD